MTDQPLKMIGVKIPADMADALTQHAKANRKTVSQVVRDLIDAKLKEYEL